jgi:hypothetical protein
MGIRCKVDRLQFENCSGRTIARLLEPSGFVGPHRLQVRLLRASVNNRDFCIRPLAIEGLGLEFGLDTKESFLPRPFFDIV